MTRRQPAPRYDGPTVLGIDASHWQGVIDWRAVAADPREVRFAIIRTGDGKDRDRRAVENLRGARDAGLLVGAYHYLRAAHSPERQAGVALDAISEALGSPRALDLPLCPDLEGRPDPDGDGPEEGTGAWMAIGAPRGPSTGVVLDCTQRFCELSEREVGLVPWLYSGTSWHWYVAQRGLVPAWAARHPLWLPSYGGSARRPRMPVGRQGEPAPWDAPLVHQYSASAAVSGVDGKVDANHYRGTLASLRGLRKPSADEPGTQPPDVVAALHGLAVGQPEAVAVELRSCASRIGAMRRCG